jgi:hypothetical protein
MTSNDEDNKYTLYEPVKPPQNIKIIDKFYANANLADVEKIVQELFDKYKDFNISKKDIFLYQDGSNIIILIDKEFPSPNYHEKLMQYCKDLETYLKLTYFK